MGKFTGIFACLMIGGYVLLFIAGLISQEAVTDSMQLSASQLKEEGYAPVLLIRSDGSYQLDNFSETRMLLSSLYMNTRETPKSVLINPTYEGEHDPIATINAVAETGNFPSADTYFTHAIMGFRSVIRVLLAFLNLRQIRRLLMWLVLLLFTANVLSIRRHSSILMSFLFAAAFLSINPIMVMSSLQYACCFILALTAMLLMPYIGKWKISEPMVFFIIGGVTQYFDLYTVPIITFGLPIIIRLLIKQREGELLTFRADLVFVCKCLGAWLTAYVGMWLCNLWVTTLFTDFNAWKDGIAVLGESIGIPGHVHPLSALAGAFKYLVTIECALCLIGFIIAWPFMMDTRARRKVGYRQGRIFLLIALLPVAWLAISSHSVLHEGYYQYRVLIVTIFSGLCFYAKPTQYLEKNMRKPI
ncbi:MAG: hypothetical protein RRZ24_04020 [Clostridia bacterium]